jgi:hypothetical protein
MLPYWRAIDPLALCSSHGLTRTAVWLQAVTSRPSVIKTSAGEAEMARASKLYYVNYATPGSKGAACESTD